jgi:hypothetical protein
MKVVYTETARNDLTDIAAWLALHYPSISSAWNSASGSPFR